MYSPYKIFKSTKGSYYSFKTKNGISYRCFFSVQNQHNNLLGLPLKSTVYTFSFYPTRKTEKVAYDRIISVTIAELLNRFFNRNPNVIISYICDNSDLRAIKRQYNFEKWFISNNNDPKKSLVKGDIANVLYVGAILLKEHPEKNKIQEFFQSEIKQLKTESKQATVDILE